MRRFVIVLLVVSLVIAGAVSYFASNSPDGLEKVAEDSGFSEKAEEPAVSVLPDYTVPGMKGFWSNGLAGIIGVGAVFGIVMLAGKIIARKKR